MAEKIATRAAYGEALVALAEEYPELVVLDADLSGSTMTKGFAKAHPDRFYNMGIAEANMTGVAAGLAACGKKPFTNTFAMFAAGRAWEQVRNSIAYPRLNVKVVGSHGGLSVGEDGATHQCIEDYAIMRAIPNMMVVSPCDGPEMRQAVRALLDYDGPAYLRLGRLAVESVTDAIPGYTFHLGQGVTLRDGSDVTVIATGMMVQMALKAAESLAAEGLSVRVLDMHTIKPLDGELVLKAALETGAIVIQPLCDNSVVPLRHVLHKRKSLTFYRLSDHSQRFFRMHTECLLQGLHIMSVNGNNIPSERLPFGRKISQS